LVLKSAISTFINIAENGEEKLLYSLYYEQEQGTRSINGSIASEASLDLAFNDEILQDVESQWRRIMSDEKGELETTFLQFEDREGMNNDDDDNDEGY